MTTFGSAKMIQGVREVFEIVDIESNARSQGNQGESVDKQGGKLVLIGRGMSGLPVEASLRSVLEI